MSTDQDTFATVLSGGDMTDNTPGMDTTGTTGAEPAGADGGTGPIETGTPAPAAPPASPQEPPAGHIPAWRLREEAERRRAAEEESAAMRRRLAELEKSRPAEPEPDFFDDPAAATHRAVAPLFEQVQQQLMFNARLAASSAYGKEKIDSAEQAFLQAYNAGQVDPLEAKRVIESPNRWVAAVEWFDRQNVLKEVGTDPTAYRQRILDEALKDPTFLQRAAEAARSQARPGAFAPPSPASTPAPGGIPSLTRTTAAAADTDEPEDAAEVFTTTLRSARR